MPYEIKIDDTTVGFCSPHLRIRMDCTMQLSTALRGEIRPILAAQYQKVEHSGRSTVPTEEAVELILETARLAFDAHPLFILPATLMLVGAICLARHRSLETSSRNRTDVDRVSVCCHE